MPNVHEALADADHDVRADADGEGVVGRAVGVAHARHPVHLSAPPRFPPIRFQPRSLTIRMSLRLPSVNLIEHMQLLYCCKWFGARTTCSRCSPGQNQTPGMRSPLQEVTAPVRSGEFHWSQHQSGSN